MQTDDLIRRLTADARPVTPLRPLAVRLAAWAVLAAASLVAVLIVMGVRRELGDVADRVGFAVEVTLLLLMALSGAAGALIVSIPGRERTALVRWVPVIAAVAYVMWTAGDLLRAAATGDSAGRMGFSWYCMLTTASIAAVPALALFIMVRRAAPLHAAWAGLLAVLATSAVGVLGSNVICPNDRPLHLIVWHVGPLMLFAAIGAALGTWLLRWTRRLR